jgi:DNA-binding CsgD family transcriptional regulator
VQQFARQHARSHRVLWGACDALITPRPLGPLHDIARQSQGRLLDLLDGRASRDTLFAAVIDELGRRDAVSLIVFEDMHWADEATLDLVKFLGRRIDRTRALLVLTYRDDEVGPRHPLRVVIGELPRTALRRLLLAPLSANAVAALAKRAGRTADGLHGVTGGNPLFVTEVLATASESIPATVSDAVLARAARLSPAAREVAEVVATVPARAEGWLLDAAVRPDEAAIESCLAIGMVRADDGSLAFRHELARRAFEDSLPPARHQALHATVLSILEHRADISHARLAHHADGARNVEQVLRLAPLAAAHAASVASHREAAAHYESAFRYADRLAPRARAELLEKLSYECYLTDQVQRAVEARRAALDIWRSLGERLKEGDSFRWLSRLSWFRGHGAQAEEYATAAIAALEPLPVGPELVMAYSNRAQLEMLANRAGSAIEWALRTIKLAEQHGYDEILSHAYNNLGAARLLRGDEAGRADLEHGLQLALAGNYQEHVARAYTNLSWDAIHRRRYDQARQYLDAGLAYSERLDLDSWRLYMLAWSAHARFEQGDWIRAAEEAEVVLRHPRTAAISRMPALTVLARMRIRRGDPDPDSLLDEARELAGSTQEVQRLGPIACVRAEAAWLAGEPERIPGETSSAYELALRTTAPWLLGELGVWLFRAGALEHPPANIPAPYEAEIRGDWRSAEQQWATIRCPYERASVLAIYGGETEQLQALSIFEQLGATAAAQLVRRKLRAQGVRQIPRGARASTRGNPHGLTKREAEILTLLQDGLRNADIAKRLFLSTKTVDHHVSAILSKLGVDSRAAAIAMTRPEGPESAT